MVLMVLETEALQDSALPVAQLAAQMRLPEGYDAVPGQDVRLRLRLRAAIVALERRLGKILLAREVVMCGACDGDRRVALPIAPVTSLNTVEIVRDGRVTDVSGARIEEDAQRPWLVLPHSLPGDAKLRVAVRAGWADWVAVPEALAQAVLMSAEALDVGETPTSSAMVEGLIAPWRVRRIGGAS